MKIDHLPPPLQSLITEFCFRATLDETKRSLHYIDTIVSRQLHPLVVRTFAADYSDCLDTQWYSQELRMSCLFGAYAPGRRIVTSPLTEFFVWYSKDELYHYDRIHRLLFDLDWRHIRPSDCWTRQSRGFCELGVLHTGRDGVHESSHMHA